MKKPLITTPTPTKATLGALQQAAHICHTVITGPTHEVIARRAYDIYLKTGRKQGQCKQNWQQAEQALSDQLEAVQPGPSFSSEASAISATVTR